MCLRLVRLLINSIVPACYIYVFLHAPVLPTPLQDRLEFLYAWAVEGPPIIFPVGLLARPKTYLTAVLQVGP